MSDITPRDPKTPEEIHARQTKIRHLALDMFVPVVAALFLILSILWPHTIFTCLAGICMGIVLIRFANSQYDGDPGSSVADRLFPLPQRAHHGGASGHGGRHRPHSPGRCPPGLYDPGSGSCPILALRIMQPFFSRS